MRLQYCGTGWKEKKAATALSKVKQHSWLASVMWLTVYVSTSFSENIVFPDHSAVKNVKTAFGAAGDGIKDDTQPLNNAFKTLNGIIYLPNGTYRVTNTIMGPGGSTCGPWVYGQSRDGVIIKLDDGAAGFGDSSNAKAVLVATSAAGSADQFMRQWHNFTVDAGKNPGAIGIRYYSNNSGILHNVRVVGNGKYGVDMGWLPMNGPLLLQDVTIEGFAIGLYTSGGLNSQTVSNLTIRNTGRYGIYCFGQNLSMEDVTIENTPIAVFSRSMMVIINGNFKGVDATKPAILNDCCYLYCRNITTSGFSRAIQSANGGVAGPTVDEYTSEPISAAFTTNRRTSSLNLPIKKSPPLDWEEDPSKWLAVTSFGAVTGDSRDDSRAFQAAIDTAASQGKTTIFFPPGDYHLGNDVKVRGTVRHFIGLGLVKIYLTGSMLFGFILEDNAAPVVRFENIYTFTQSMPGIFRSVVSNNTSTLVIDNCDGWTICAHGSGDVFINNTCALLEITNSAAHVWARQWNTEGHFGIDSDNRGGFLWILGLKTEHGMTKISTSQGGMTELLGAHIYNTNSAAKTEPLFEIKDAQASFACIRETCFNNAFYTVHVREARGAEVRTWRDATDRSWALYSGADSSWKPPELSRIRHAPRRKRSDATPWLLRTRHTLRSSNVAPIFYTCRGERLLSAQRCNVAGVVILAAAQEWDRAIPMAIFR